MLNISQMLRKQSSMKHVPLWVIEKDYAISYLLAAIADTAGLGDSIVLKGGTALKKAYFSEYRFSEDLDYSSLVPDTRFDIDKLITVVTREAEDLLLENGPFIVQSEPLTLRESHPEGQIAFIVRVQFPYHRQPLCRLKIEISINEPVILPPERRYVLHDFPESFTTSIQAYPLEEIVAEKLRALLQSHARLQTRGWGASRVCRDYYDIWWILKQSDLSHANLLDLTGQKCAVKGIKVSSPSDFFSPALLDTVRKQWQQMLSPFIPDLPDADIVLRETQAEVYQLWSEAK